MANLNEQKRYCSECEHYSEFSEVKLEESLRIKGVPITASHIYYECNNCKELFESFDDPDYNTRIDFEIYSFKVGILKPVEIKQLRENYGLSLRQFAEIIGISYSTLSEIENGYILHSKHLDSTLRLCENPVSFRDLFLTKEKFLKGNYDGVKENLLALCLSSDDRNAEIVGDFKAMVSDLADKTQEAIRVTNILKYESEDLNRKINGKENGSWSEKVIAVFSS
ncbi:hypothetical protein BAU15_09135 [Enterococcus sp. JM4C]|uniref:helix-turn-helix domain-containing protein n=1 Tax=Candidatus Enterococcus huntleyi TaxID=1857217 RepID=UPI00137B2872|nr:helix-turn-helix domain-containing protein [Enterococcus sp. JM4C]KAF1296799.1 hypothetical protein BAU15_09135 [Enterococcus sp. JM4C]